MKRRILREIFENFLKFFHRIDVDKDPGDLLDYVDFLIIHFFSDTHRLAGHFRWFSTRVATQQHPGQISLPPLFGLYFRKNLLEQVISIQYR